MKKKIIVEVPISTARKLKSKSIDKTIIADALNKELAQINAEESRRDEILSMALKSLYLARARFRKALEYHKRLPKRFSADFRHNADKKISELIEWAEKELFWIAGKDVK